MPLYLLNRGKYTKLVKLLFVPLHPRCKLTLEDGAISTVRALDKNCFKNVQILSDNSSSVEYSNLFEAKNSIVALQIIPLSSSHVMLNSFLIQIFVPDTSFFSPLKIPHTKYTFTDKCQYCYKRITVLKHTKH